MSLWQKFKNGVRKFMIGRNGADELSFALLILALILSLFSTGIPFLHLLGTAAYVFCLFRLFSKNTAKRRVENYKYVQMMSKAKTSVSQFWVRMKNRKNYRYFRCPECKSMLKLPRKVGEVTVTCGKCHHAFKQKA